MAEIIKRRDALKKSLTRLSKLAVGENMPAVDAKVHLEGLEKYFDLYLQAQLAVDEVTGREAADYEEIELINMEKVFLQTKVFLSNIIEAARPQVLAQAQAPVAQPGVQPPQINTKMKIGAITLPKFSGEYRDWPSFSDLFSSLVRNDNSISPAQKLYLLKAHLTGEAEGLIRALPVTDANFAAAWTLIEDRYNNKRFIVEAHLKVLLGQNKLNAESAKGLKSLVDSSREAVRCLEALELPIGHWDAILVYVLTGKLDPETHRQWELSLDNPSELSTFEDLLKFLDSRWKSLEMIPALVKPKPFTSTPTKSPKSSAAALVATQDIKSACDHCKGDHNLSQCEKFKIMDTAQRRSVIFENNLCFKCLRSGHTSTKCSAKRCSNCKGRHHILLHQSPKSAKSAETSPAQASNSNLPSSSPKEDVNVPSTSVSTLHSQGSFHVVLSTAIVIVRNEYGQEHQIRALLDTGSEASFITEDCAQRLRLRRSPAYINISGVGKTDAGCTRGVVTLNLASCVDSSFSMTVSALILNKITNLVPRKELTKQSWPHLRGVKLADAEFDQPGRVDMLIGADVYGNILLDGLIPSLDDSPTAQNTRLGWILMGRTSQRSSDVVNCNLSNIDRHIDLEQSLKRFWEIESLEDKVETLTTEEKACEEHFLRTHSRDSTGRFVVRLPLLVGKQLGESKNIALKRFHSVERRLSTNPELKSEYVKFMREYEALDHMRPVRSLHANGENSYFLPHHAVLKESSSTTKVRVVFDASCKTTTGCSLNDLQMTGAKLQDNLYDIVLRFRRHRIALSADIVKMYRQILVHPDDQNYQRLLWREEPKADVQEYCLRTVTYGMAAAPYLAIRSLRQLAIVESDNFATASKVVLSDFYVDDLITGCNDISEATRLQGDLTAMLSLGGFELRKWSSNESAAIDHLPVEFRESKSPLAMSDEDVVGTLGILWYPNTDNFGFIVRRYSANSKVTKRSILSEISRLFDPLGWLAPTIIIGKMMLQELWLLGVVWDEVVPAELCERWLTYRDSLVALEQIRIPRWLQSTPISPVQLHGFCDASEKAMAAVVYMRVVTASGLITTTLVTAKTKVAPVKTLSIPRLELCGAQMLAKLLLYVRRTLCLQDDTISVAWTDSTIVLAWLQKMPNVLKTFVANRVSDIQGRIAPSCWRHVKSEDNPADCGSRGVLPEMLPTHSLWWNGPPWLVENEDIWPVSQIASVTEAHLELKEKKKTSLGVSLSLDLGWDLLDKFSNYTKLIRITSYLQRFAKNVRPNADRQHGYLTTVETHAAMIFWVKKVQNEFFASDIKCCRNKLSLPRGSKLIDLHPFIDEKEIVRVGGRLSAAALEEDHKHPIILPEKSKFTHLLISDIHLKLQHSGTQLTLNQLRQTFWVIGGRRVVSKIIRQCLVCCRQRSTTRQQLMGDLPAQRVRANRPFLSAGVDYAGPIMLRMSKGRGTKSVSKGYIALFVCFTTKAIHLELASDLTSDAFLAAYRRFVARRGVCRELFSDNGTNFVGARNELRKMLKDEKLTRQMVENGTAWEMIPPGSPHQGGLWEAGVKSVKFHLRRIVGETILTFEELSTVLAQVEAVLNSRPLCPLSDDPSDIAALTPSHFLVGEPLTSVPEPDRTSVPMNRLKRWHQIQQMQQHFWNRWQSEYLSTLQTRSKWRKGMANVKVGDLVIIKDERMPPCKWNLGRIIECHPGSDGLVRVATIKYQGGTTTRSVTKLCVLPIE